MWKELYEINGIQFYAVRRRYGSTTYTWVHVKEGDVFVELPVDPWPCVTPKKTEVWQEYERWYAGQQPELVPESEVTLESQQPR